MAETIKIATVNCQGLASKSKCQDVLNFYKKKKYSIVCLQDTHFTEDVEPYVETQWGYTCIFNSFRSNARGVSIMFNNNFEFKINKTQKDTEGNLIALDITIEDHKVTLINIYGPNSDKPSFYEEVREIFLDFDNEYFILCGDFNLVLNPSLDTENYCGTINNPKARGKLLEVMSDLQLLDYYRTLNPDKKVFTWRKKNPFKQGRLDYILISENLSNLVETFLVKPGYRSDHSSVVLEIKFNAFERGRGLWKFNNSLLLDKIYVDKVKDTIQQVHDQYASPLDNKLDNIEGHKFLEILLMEIRGITISYSSYKKKERDKREKKLIEDIEKLESITDINTDLISAKKTELENLRKEKLQGHIIRSRAKWVEEGEKPTKYFCNLERRNFINKTIKKVELEENRTIYNQSEILQQIKIFYENLYTCKDSELIDINIAEVIKLSDIPRLDKHTAESLEGNVSEKEILSALKNMKNNKTPGS